MNKEQLNSIDHPIFAESIRFIQSQLGFTGLDPLQQQVLERIIHTSGDFSLKDLIRFSPGSCEKGVSSLLEGAPILTDTAMAAAAIAPMAKRTLDSKLYSALDWVPEKVIPGMTRTAVGIERAWQHLTKEFSGKQAPIVVIGSAPKALDDLLQLVLAGYISPSLIIGMPVGFIGVSESKMSLSKSGLPHIRLEGSRGGASLASAAINALLRASFFSKKNNTYR